MFLLLGLCVAGPATAQTYEVVHSFVIPGGSPMGALAVSPAGALYGTQETGGVYRRGSIFSLTPDGSGGFTLLTLHSFTGPDGASPRSTLIFGADGNLYGTTPKGGGTDSGTAFRITPSGAFTRLHDFADGGGKSPSELVLASDGAFYGTASEGGAHDGGTIFRIGTDEVFSTVHDFDGAVEGTAPLGGLLEADGHLWGTTSLGGTAGLGTVFRLDLPATVVTVHEFQGTDGATPAAALIRALDGLLYGTTRAGGALNAGTVFRMDELGTLTTLKSLDSNSGDTPIAPLFQASDGKFYGTTTSGGPGGGKDDFPAGTVFRIDSAGTFERLYAFNAGLFGTPGSSPFGGLADGGDGFLYGTTAGRVYGTVYRISLAGALTYPYFFEGIGDGEGLSSPIGPLTEANGAIYGAARSLFGVLFRLDGSEATLFYQFGGPDGSFPNGGLILGSDGDLYGTTNTGGTSLLGTAFRIDAGGTLETLHSFTGADGSYPAAGLIENPDGEFYGTTADGGAEAYGTVFHMSNTGDVTTLHSFTFSLDGGANPYAPLILAADGNFFGTTNYGGGVGSGTVFKLDTLGAVTTFHAFNESSEGLYAEGPVLQASDDALYGVLTTAKDGQGVIYRLDASGTFTNLHSFNADSSEGALPGSALIQASDGLLYGTAPLGGGLTNFGTVFRTDLFGNFGVVHFFDGNDGSTPNGGLLEASDGALYGAATMGGFGGGGVVYRLVIAAATASVTGIDPSSGRAAGGTPVAITGEHLYGVSVVTIGGAAATAPAARDQAQIFTVSPALEAGTLNDVTVGAPGAAAGPTLAAAWFADFNDVPQDDIFHAYVETIFRAGITAGCGGGNYCRNDAVRRDQMAVFLLKAEHGGRLRPSCLLSRLYGCPLPEPVCRLDRTARDRRRHGRLRRRQLLPRKSRHARPDGRLPPEDEGRLELRPAAGSRHLRRRPAGRFVRALDRGDRQSRDHRRLPGCSAALLPRRSQHARPDGGLPREDVRVLVHIEGAAHFRPRERRTPRGLELASRVQPSLSEIAGGALKTTRRNGIRSVLLFSLCAAAGNATAQTYEIFHTFALPGGHPVGPAVASPAGSLYGTTTDAGLFARGSVFVMTPDGSGGFTYQTLHSFVGPEGASPHAALIFGADGTLYGSAIEGGAAGAGTLFRISPTGTFTRLHDFADGGGEQPSELFLASDGAFYGTTRAGGAHGGGTVFRLGADESFSTVHDFDGAVEGTQPLAAPVQSGSFLYGTTNLGGANGIGTIYKVDMATAQTSKVYEFDSAVGANPAAALLRASDGNLYGTAARGGNGFGSVFRMDASETVTLFYAFNYNPDGREPVAPLMQLSDGKLYGTTDDGGAGAPPNTVARGSVFRIDTLGNFEWLASFYADSPPPPPAPLAAALAPDSLASPANTPFSGVTDGHDGFLYGTLAYPYGAVYRISPTDPQPASFPHVFGTAEGPYYPEGPLTEANGALYTTASASAERGSLLRFDGPRMTVLHDFAGINADGANPTTAGLVLASDGGLYGSTPNGGYAVNGWGTLYRLTSGGVFETLHVFQPPEGAQPTAGLLETPAGQFWSVASAGGTSNYGTIFRIDSAGTFSLLHQFFGPDGNGPFSGFALGTDGKLYGTTAYGGPSDDGTIFTMDTLGAFTSNVYDFDGQHGVHPFAGLLRASDGNLYGMSSRGGASDAGVIFRFDGSSMTSVHDFDGTDGSTPLASLIEASDGKLYGTTTGRSQRVRQHLPDRHARKLRIAPRLRRRPPAGKPHGGFRRRLLFQRRGRHRKCRRPFPIRAR